jgi:hypothetical protein
LLFPDIIYKWANSYNQAYVVIESNDAGALVCQGIYHEMEYENVHMESMTKSSGIGVEMTRRIKRLGCSGFKDLMETNKLDIVDENTILEISTFEVKGASYEASSGNHDDLVMNFVMFGYLTSTTMFQELTDIDIKKMMFNQRMQEIEEDVPPFGFQSDAVPEITYEEKMDPWSMLHKDDDDW